jgi:2,4-dienoyl-CoA reductase-like NADH-dependent reductase (Old Yellow Enzyme family)
MNRISDEAPPFTPYALGELKLRNRVVMASMTRGRVGRPGAGRAQWLAVKNPCGYW